MEYYIVIAYDTPSDQRRRKMVKALKRYGERRQYSLFEIRASRIQWAKLKRDLGQVVDEAEDRLAAYFLSPEALERAWRVGHEELKPTHDPDFV